MPKVKEFSAFHTLSFRVRFMPTKKGERIDQSGTRRRYQEWATSCDVILMDKRNKIIDHRMANGLEEIPYAMKKLLQTAGLTIEAAKIRPKKI